MCLHHLQNQRLNRPTIVSQLERDRTVVNKQLLQADDASKAQRIVTRQNWVRSESSRLNDRC